MAVALPKQDISGNTKNLDEQIETMISRGETLLRDGHGRMVRAYVCNVCGKECVHKNHAKDHIEANHLEGILLPCNHCEKTYGSRASLRMRLSRHAKNKPDM